MRGQLGAWVSGEVPEITVETFLRSWCWLTKLQQSQRTRIDDFYLDNLTLSELLQALEEQMTLYKNIALFLPDLWLSIDPCAWPGETKLTVACLKPDLMSSYWPGLGCCCPWYFGSWSLSFWRYWMRCCDKRFINQSGKYHPHSHMPYRWCGSGHWLEAAKPIAHRPRWFEYTPTLVAM